MELSLRYHILRLETNGDQFRGEPESPNLKENNIQKPRTLSSVLKMVLQVNKGTARLFLRDTKRRTREMPRRLSFQLVSPILQQSFLFLVIKGNHALCRNSPENIQKYKEENGRLEPYDPELTVVNVAEQSQSS